jgi:putative ATPase
MTDQLFQLPGDDPMERSIAGDAAPLAERMRPTTLEDVVGQEHLTGPNGALFAMLTRGIASSIILWGPPGTGKTTLARLLADLFGLRFVQMSAIGTGVAELKTVFAEARASMSAGGRTTLLFIDEIHRFNKAQQDSFLPHMESGVIALVGATTENPSFELNGALLSRAQTFVLRPLDETALDAVLTRAEEANAHLPITPEARAALIANCGGDARFLLGQAEMLMSLTPAEPLDVEAVEALVQRRLATHDKAADGHYDLASAFQKSVRGSDPHAALYWGARMFVAGDVAMLIRRMTVTASEEVGMADPSALLAVMAASEAHRRLGDKEGWPVLAQAIVHVSVAPKSNASYSAAGEALAFAQATANVKPPKRIMNAPTRLMKDQGYKEGYVYDHDAPRAFSGQDFWPDDLQPQTFYRPTDRGQEPRIAERLTHWDAIREQNRRKTRN